MELVECLERAGAESIHTHISPLYLRARVCVCAFAQSGRSGRDRSEK